MKLVLPQLTALVKTIKQRASAYQEPEEIPMWDVLETNPNRNAGSMETVHRSKLVSITIARIHVLLSIHARVSSRAR